MTGSGYACEWAYEVSDSDDLGKGDGEEVIAIHKRVKKITGKG